jgi:antitoxin component of MazEF toxin-antitoxin module
MKTIELKVTRIGNSHGVRLPTDLLMRHTIRDSVILVERSNGFMLCPSDKAAGKLSWEETALEMSREDEDWSEWDGVAADGLDNLPWEDTGTATVRGKRGAVKRKKA